MRETFGPYRDDALVEWRGQHNEELDVLYSSPNIVRVVKSRRMRWFGHIARVGRREITYRVLVGKPERKRPLGRIILKRTFKTWDGEGWNGLIWLRVGTGGGLL